MRERHVATTKTYAAASADLGFVLPCRACLGRTPAAIAIQREVIGPLPQSIGSQRPFAHSAGGPPAEKDTEVARGLDTVAPITEEYKAARAFEFKFEGWRCVQGASCWRLVANQKQSHCMCVAEPLTALHILHQNFSLYKDCQHGILHYPSTIAESSGRLSSMGWPHHVSGCLDMCQETQQLRDRHPVSPVQSTRLPLCV